MMRFDIKVDRGSFFVVSKLGEPEYSDIRASLPENELKIVDNFSDIVEAILLISKVFRGPITSIPSFLKAEFIPISTPYIILSYIYIIH